MANGPDARRRWFGLFYLFIAIGMLIWGQTVLKPYLAGVGYLIYWTACFAFTFLALITALIDFRAVRRSGRAQQRELLKQALSDIESDVKEEAELSDENQQAKRSDRRNRTE